MNKITYGKNVQIGQNVVISGSGKIGDNVKIGHNCVIEGNFQIGNNTNISHGVIVVGDIQIGQNNYFGPYCVIGTYPQDTQKRLPQHKNILIGDNNVIREYTTVHPPLMSNQTQISDDCYIMAYSHIAHDCIIGNCVVMANQSTLGGHTVIDDNSTLGLNVCVHQFVRIGSYSMVGMGSVVTKDVPPGALILKNKFAKINVIGLKRKGFSDKQIEQIEKFYSNSKGNDQTNFLQNIVSFIENSEKYYKPEFKCLNQQS